MKIYIKAICTAAAFMLIFSGCSENNAEISESSVEEISVVSKTLTAYEKKVMNDAVETSLDNACKTLYECVCKGSVTKESVNGKFSFANALPDGNTSPNQKIQAAGLLTIRNAVEYFSLGEIYTDENIRQYGYITVDHTDINLIRGTVVNTAKWEVISTDFIRFDTLDTELGSFISSYSMF